MSRVGRSKERTSTSTIQILVFWVVGAGAASGLRIRWDTVARLALLWVLALIGAMAGTGLARGRHTIDARVMLGVARAWLIDPAAGMARGFAFARLVPLNWT